MQRVVIVEDGRAVQQADATDGSPQDRVVVRCSRQGACEREERIAAVTPADLKRLTAPAQRARRISGARERVALACLRAGIRAVALDDRVDIGPFSSSAAQRLRMAKRK